MELKLYYTPHTRSLRPRWLVEELGVACQLHSIDLFGGEGQSEEYKRINPLGAVPAMEINGEVLLESGAICHWIADQCLDKGLAPPMDDPARRRYEQWMFFAPGTLEPPAILVLLHSMILSEAQRIAAIVPWALERHATNLAVLEQEIKGKEYLLGTEFSAADIMVGSTLMWLPDTLNEFPALQAYTKRLKERSAYQQATKE